MHLDLRNQVSIHNRYEFELLDASTHQVKQRAYAENIVLDTLWTTLLGRSGGSYDVMGLFQGVRMGTGSGTPSVTDTTVFTLAFNYRGTFTAVSLSEASPTSSYVYRISIPATSAYTGDLTEIGLIGGTTSTSSGSVTAMWTHAMLKDSEGNPITITKTDLDVLTITITIYVTFGSTDNNFHWYVPGPNNAICYAFRSVTAIMPFVSGSNQLCHCGTIALDDNGCITSIIMPTGAALGSSTYSGDTKTYGVSTQRLGTSAGNTRYYQGLVLRSSRSDCYFGGIVYPNASIFPNYTMQNMRVGTGDGVTTHFDIPIEFFVADTDVVKVNGTTLTKGADYTIDNVNELLTADDTMSLSNFLVPVSGVTLSSDYNTYGVLSNNFLHVPLAQGIATQSSLESALKSNDPLILRVLNTAASDKLNATKLQHLCMYRRYYSDGDELYPQNQILFYETRPNLNLTAITSPNNTVPYATIINMILADPTSVTSVTAQNTLVTKMHIYCSTNGVYQSVNVPFIHPTDYTIYYMWVTLANGRRIPVAITQGDVYPFDGFYWHKHSGSYYCRFYRTVTIVNDTKWTCYWWSADSVFTFSEVTDNCFCTPAFTPHNGNFFAGCNIVLSGSSSAQGPWTTLQTIDLSTLESFQESYNYYNSWGLSDVSDTLQEATYEYYKVSLDVSNATNLALYGSNPDVFLNIENVTDGYNAQPATMVLGYSGSGITFTTAPAQDAVITLDAAIDRPFKNSNFVLDSSMSLQFGGA